MNLSKTNKNLLGIATIITIVVPSVIALIWLMIIILSNSGIAFTEGTRQKIYPAIGATFCLSIPILMVIGSLTIGLSIFYLVHLIKNEQGNNSIRIISAIGFLFLPFIAVPVYFFLYIWPENPPRWAMKPA